MVRTGRGIIDIEIQRPVLVGNDPAAGGVVTYENWPLYLYVADPTAGTYNGQGLNSKGGLWYVVSPSNVLVTQHQHALQLRGLL